MHGSPRRVLRYLRIRPFGTSAGDQALSQVVRVPCASLSMSEVLVMELRTAQINLLCQSPPGDMGLGMLKYSDGVLGAFSFEVVTVRKYFIFE